jgi:hypothetical protein
VASPCILMAIYRLLERDASFGPEAVKAMSVAYEGILRSLRLADRSDPMTVIVAKKIIDVAKTGLRDAGAIQLAVLKELQ